MVDKDKFRIRCVLSKRRISYPGQAIKQQRFLSSFFFEPTKKQLINCTHLQQWKHFLVLLLSTLSPFHVPTLLTNNLTLPSTSPLLLLSNSNPFTQFTTGSVRYFHVFFFFFNNRTGFLFMCLFWDWFLLIFRFQYPKRVIRMQAVDEDYEVKQVRDMAAARKRWESLVFFLSICVVLL